MAFLFYTNLVYTIYSRMKNMLFGEKIPFAEIMFSLKEYEKAFNNTISTVSPSPSIMPANLI